MAKEMNAEELMDLGLQAEESGDTGSAIKYYQAAAEAGSTDGLASIGLLYQYGTGVEQSYEKALAWYQKVIDAEDMDGYWMQGNVYREAEEYETAVKCYEIAAEKGENCRYAAIYELARAYRYGVGAEENFPLALDYYQRAASNGVVEAMFDLGAMYAGGEGVAQDFDIANYWYEMAAFEGESAKAFGELGIAYYFGRGDKDVDYDKAREYFERALKEGEEEYLYPLGRIYYDEEQYDKAMEYYLQAAANDNEYQSLAEDDIGDMYRNGNGVKRNLKKAIEWYKKGAEHDNANSMCSLGHMYESGEGVEKDSVQAAHWTLLAAKQGDVTAMENMGYHYENGIGVEQDYIAAMAWHKCAADAGDSDAMYSIGDLYYFGNGVEKDYSLAKDWYEKAIMAGNEAAFMPLGTIYYYGDDYGRAMEFYLKALSDDNPHQHIAEARIGDLYREGAGVERDMAKVVEWYKKSAGHGYDFAMLVLGDIYMEGDGIEQDIEEAKRWYEKAKEAGNEEAEQRLADLA